MLERARARRELEGRLLNEVEIAISVLVEKILNGLRDPLCFIP